jgi:ribosomal protein S18 acetylase RimI-like enzyme
MTVIQENPVETYTLRAHQPGDMGWVIYRHAVLYNKEYGWNGEFEVIVADIARDFLQNFDSDKERCWIAEQDGDILGSIFLVKQSDTIAKLRMFYIEPEARGMGLGNRLVQNCVQLAREKGYQKILLETANILLPARHLYQKAGFQLIHEEPRRSFGADIVVETWELELNHD